MVSIIIPTFNRADVLGRCLQSLVNQTYKNFEVLVCDDGSTDNSKEIIDKFVLLLKIKYFKNKNFGGPARPRNIGILHSVGKYLAFLDSDDWWAPKKLEISVLALEAGADVVYHDLYLMPVGILKPTPHNKSKTRQLMPPVFNDLIAGGHAINTSSVLVRKKLMKKINGFSEDRDLIAAEDFDAWLRLATLTNRFHRIPECLGYYEVGNNNLSNPYRTIINLKRICEIYSAAIDESGNKKPYWISYTLGLSYFKIRNYRKSVAIFLEINFLKNHIYFFIRRLFK